MIKSCGKIREDAKLNTTPIVLLTAKADEDLRATLLRGGAQDYLTEPFHGNKLLARLAVSSAVP